MNIITKALLEFRISWHLWCVLMRSDDYVDTHRRVFHHSINIGADRKVLEENLMYYV